jgi:hypothetical protein
VLVVKAGALVATLVTNKILVLHVLQEVVIVAEAAEESVEAVEHAEVVEIHAQKVVLQHVLALAEAGVQTVVVEVVVETVKEHVKIIADLVVSLKQWKRFIMPCKKLLLKIKECY